MRANEFTCTDYREEGGGLVLTLPGADPASALAADWSLVAIATDAGDVAETFAGFAARSATLDAATGAVELRLVSGADAAVIGAVRRLAEENAALKAESSDVMDAVAELGDVAADLMDAVTALADMAGKEQ